MVTTFKTLSPRVLMGCAALVAVAAVAGASGALAGGDATFAPALTTFTSYLNGTGGKVIALLSLVGGIIGMAGGGFRLGQVAGPVGVGIAAGVGTPIVTAAITAVI